MKLLDSAKANPGWPAAIAVVVGSVGLFAGMDKLAWYWQAHATAYAAHQEAETLKSKFDEYIAHREEEAKLEKQRIELQAQYNERLLQIQQQQQMQQQVPNAPVGASRDYNTEPFFREWDDTDQTTWCCDSNDYEACYRQQLWYRCE